MTRPMAYWSSAMASDHRFPQPSLPQRRRRRPRKLTMRLAFDADDAASVVFTGTGGYFCAGADLKAVASGDPKRSADRGHGRLPRWARSPDYRP